MIEKIQKCCSATEDLGNKKTSQLIDVGKLFLKQKQKIEINGICFANR